MKIIKMLFSAFVIVFISPAVNIWAMDGDKQQGIDWSKTVVERTSVDFSSSSNDLVSSRETQQEVYAGLSSSDDGFIPNDLFISDCVSEDDISDASEDSSNSYIVTSEPSVHRLESPTVYSMKRSSTGALFSDRSDEPHRRLSLPNLPITIYVENLESVDQREENDLSVSGEPVLAWCDQYPEDEECGKRWNVSQNLESGSEWENIRLSTSSGDESLTEERARSYVSCLTREEAELLYREDSQTSGGRSSSSSEESTLASWIREVPSCLLDLVASSRSSKIEYMEFFSDSDSE